MSTNETCHCTYIYNLLYIVIEKQTTIFETYHMNHHFVQFRSGSSESVFEEIVFVAAFSFSAEE